MTALRRGWPVRPAAPVTLLCYSLRSALSSLLQLFRLKSESELARRMTFNHTHREARTKTLGTSNSRAQIKHEAEEKSSVWESGKMEYCTCQRSVDMTLTRKMTFYTPPHHSH